GGADPLTLDRPTSIFQVPNIELARQVRVNAIKSKTLRIASLHSDRDCVTRASEGRQTHRHRRPRGKTARHPDVALVQAVISGSPAEEQHRCQPPTNGYLRRNHTAVEKAGEIDFQCLAGNSGTVRRNKLMVGSMQDRAVAVAGN